MITIAIMDEPQRHITKRLQVRRNPSSPCLHASVSSVQGRSLHNEPRLWLSSPGQSRHKRWLCSGRHDRATLGLYDVDSSPQQECCGRMTNRVWADPFTFQRWHLLRHSVAVTRDHRMNPKAGKRLAAAIQEDAFGLSAAHQQRQ